MTIVIVLFNLKDPGSVVDYERWAREVDVPTAGALPSVASFEVLKTQGVFGGGSSPYQYIEVLRIDDMTQFALDVASASMQAVAARFKAFADQPLFILSEAL